MELGKKNTHYRYFDNEFSHLTGRFLHCVVYKMLKQQKQNK